MSSPYVKRGIELDIISGLPAPKVLPELKPPKPPIRQLPLPRLLFPGLKEGR